MRMDKNEEIIKISEEILNDFESCEATFESILFKIKKLARIRDDFEMLVMINLELMGYKDFSIIPDLPPGASILAFARKSGRIVHEKNQQGEEKELYWTLSISEIETGISNAKSSLLSIQTPQNFTPAIAKFRDGGSIVQESLRNVLDKLAKQKSDYSKEITRLCALLSKIKNSFYSYVLNIYYKTAFDSITETLFQQTKNSVDKKLQRIAPGVLKKLVAAYNRINSTNDEELSQAMSSCRNALKEFANAVFPARKGDFIRSDGSKMSVTDDKYKNRLIAFLEEHEEGKSKAYLVARLNDLIARVHSLNDLLSKGTHNGIDANFVNICIIDTYLVIGGMLDYHTGKPTSDLPQEN